MVKQRNLNRINHLDDDIALLEELIKEEMYERSEQRLYSFFVNFWNTFDPQPLVPNWHLECLCEHIQAALNRDLRRLIINIPPRCLPGLVNINMGDGSYKAIKDIVIGDQVLSSDTKQIHTNKVIDVISAGNLPCVEITFSDGNKLQASTKHKLYTVNRGWIEAGKLLSTDVVVSPKTYLSSDFYLPVDDAYLLGVWVAKGFKANRGAFAFANDTPEIVNKVISIAESKGWRYRYDKQFTHRFINPEGEVRGTGIKGSIRKWFETYIPEDEYPTNCYDVRIPSCIFRANKEAKIEFLNAFIACDGWIDTSSGKIATEVASEQLAKDIYRLFKQLGYSPTLKSRLPRLVKLPQGTETISSKHYSCTISQNKELQKAKTDFNFYHKQIKLLSINEKNTSRLNDVPACLIPLDKVNCKYRYRVKNSKWLQSTTLQEYCIDEEWYESLRLDTFKYLQVKQVDFIGEHECFDLTVAHDHTYFAEDILTHNSSKSTTASISAPCFRWLTHPEEKFWLISHSARLYMQNIVYARRILTHPLYQDRWCNKKDGDNFRFSLAEDVNTKSRIDNDKGGSLLGGSPTSNALGMGYTVAIIDDALDSEESNSPIAIQDVNNWYTQTFMNRTNDPKTDVVIIVMQRLAENDLTNYVLETYKEQGWFTLSLPARYIPDRTFVSPIGYNDKRTKPNQLLDPERLTDEFLHAQSKDKITYNTRYQQNPSATADGYFIKDEWLQEINTLPIKFHKLITVWDLSITENPTSSYTVGLVVGRYDKNFYIIDMWRNQCEIQDQLDGIRLFKCKYPKNVIGIESRANGHAAMSMLNREIKDIYRIEPRLFGGSKEQRLSSVVDYFRNKRVFIYNPIAKQDIDYLHDTYDVNAIKSELKSFPLGKYNDIVDCASYGIQYLAEYGNESLAVVTQGKRISYTEEDYAIEQAIDRGKINQYLGKDDTYDYEIFLDQIPSRDFINTIGW